MVLETLGARASRAKVRPTKDTPVTMSVQGHGGEKPMAIVEGFAMHHPPKRQQRHDALQRHKQPLLHRLYHFLRIPGQAPKSLACPLLEKQLLFLQRRWLLRFLPGIAGKARADQLCFDMPVNASRLISLFKQAKQQRQVISLWSQHGSWWFASHPQSDGRLISACRT